MPIDAAPAAKGDQADLFLFARLKTNGSPGGNIQAHPIRVLALEYQRGIRLKEVIVAPDLNGTITCVLDKQPRGSAPSVGLNVTNGLVEQIFSWFHRLCSLSLCIPGSIVSE